MKRKTLVYGFILTLAVMTACGKKPVPIETSVSTDETAVSVDASTETSVSQDKSESDAPADTSKTPVKKEETKEDKKKSYERYNNAGELIYKIDYDDKGHPTYEYDNEGGNVLVYTYELKDENGNDVLYKYDAGGNLLVKWEYYGRSLNVHVESGYYNGTETYEIVYLESGETVSHKTYNGTSTDNEYDSAGNLVKSTEATGYDTYSYNDSNKLVEQKGYDESGALLYTITNEYDANGNISKGTEEYADGSESVTASYNYDDNGLISEIVTDFGGGYLEKDIFVRDAAGREIEYRYVSVDNGSETEIQKVTKEYDNYDNVVLETYYSMGKKGGETKYVYTYDGAGKITKKETYHNGELSNVENYAY